MLISSASCSLNSFFRLHSCTNRKRIESYYKVLRILGIEHGEVSKLDRRTREALDLCVDYHMKHPRTTKKKLIEIYWSYFYQLI